MSTQDVVHKSYNVHSLLSSSRNKTSVARYSVTALLICIILGSSLASAESPMHAQDISKQSSGGRISVNNGAVTVTVVAGGTHPQFFWYANNDSNSIYRVQFKGLVEYLDYGQRIYQRRFQADIQQRINNLTTMLRPLNASSVNSTVTVFGLMRENHDNETMGLFNYVVVRAGQQIGVNVTNSTVVIGKLSGEVIVRGLVKNSSSTLYLNASSAIQLTGLAKDLRDIHPPFFEFNQGKWNFTGFQPITSGNTTIGYQFSFILQELRNPAFKNLDGQIEIRSRIYNTTVQEGNLTVTSASVKSDVIIKSWKWNVDSDLANALGIDPSKDNLALWLDLTTFNARATDAENGTAHPSLTEVKSGDQKIDTNHQGESTGDNETELTVRGKEGRLNFISNNSALAGFFNFTSYAYTYPQDTPAANETVPVTAAYLSAGNSLSLFLSYPNFGNKTLEHDPTMGVETQDISTTPQYTVNVNSGSATPTSQTTTTITTTSRPTTITSSTTTVSSSSTSATSTRSQPTTSQTTTSIITSSTTSSIISTSQLSSQASATNNTLLITVAAVAVLSVLILGAIAAKRRGSAA